MRRSCWAYTAIARVWEKAHTGCHSCYHQADWTEAHGSLRSGRAAAVIEGLATAVVALQEEQHMVMRSRVMAAGRDAGTAVEGIAVGVVAVAVEVVAEAHAAAGIAQAKESAWVPAATWRKTCRRGIGSRWRRRFVVMAREVRPPSLAAGISQSRVSHALRGRPRESSIIRVSTPWSWE